MNFSEQLERVSNRSDQIMRICTVLLTAGFTVLIFATVLSRYVFDFSILFSQGVSKLLFIWACFFAATVTYKRNAHIRLEFAESFLGRNGVILSEILIHLLSLVFFGLIFIKSISYISQIWETYFPLIGISQGWIYVSVLISSVVFFLHNLIFFFGSLESLKDWNVEKLTTT